MFFSSILPWLALIITVHAVRTTVPADYVPVTYSEVGLLNPDNTTQVDAMNVIRCIHNSGFNSSVNITVSGDGQLVIISNVTGTDKESFKKTIAKCVLILGNGIAVSSRYDASDTADCGQVTDISEAKNSENIGLFAGVSRNQNTRASRTFNILKTAGYFACYVFGISNCGFTQLSGMVIDRSKRESLA